MYNICVLIEFVPLWFFLVTHQSQRIFERKEYILVWGLHLKSNFIFIRLLYFFVNTLELASPLTLLCFSAACFTLKKSCVESYVH